MSFGEILEGHIDLGRRKPGHFNGHPPPAPRVDKSLEDSKFPKGHRGHQYYKKAAVIKTGQKMEPNAVESYIVLFGGWSVSWFLNFISRTLDAETKLKSGEETVRDLPAVSHLLTGTSRARARPHLQSYGVSMCTPLCFLLTLQACSRQFLARCSDLKFSSLKIHGDQKGGHRGAALTNQNT